MPAPGNPASAAPCEQGSLRASHSHSQQVPLWQHDSAMLNWVTFGLLLNISSVHPEGCDLHEHIGQSNFLGRQGAPAMHVLS